MTLDNAALESDRTRPKGARLLWVDMARGAAVVAMVVYHTAWDLSQLDFIVTDITVSAPWQAFARLIAGSFLVLVGVSLVLAHRAKIRFGPFLKRLAVVCVAALAVTVTTRLVFPESYIFFGILHNVAVSSLVALPFVRWPAAASALAAAAFLAMPSFAPISLVDHPLLTFLGLGAGVPVTDDFVPVFPWTGFVLAGVAAARAAERHLLAVDAPMRRSRIGPLLAAIGRRSLLIYLVHQPLIFGTLYAVREVVGPSPVAEASPFLTNCAATCQKSGQSAELCGRSCACTVEELKLDGLWPAILRGEPTAEEMARASALARGCLDRLREAGAAGR